MLQCFICYMFPYDTVLTSYTAASLYSLSLLCGFGYNVDDIVDPHFQILNTEAIC